MTVLVVGSVALDSVETPFGKADDVLGGSATFFSSAASLLTPVQLVGVVGSDYPIEKLEPLKARGVDLAGLEHADGPSFRWRGRYTHDLNSAETLETHLGVFSHFSPKIPAQFKNAPFVFLANIDPRLQLDVLQKVKQSIDAQLHTSAGSLPARVADNGNITIETVDDYIRTARSKGLTERNNGYFETS